MMAVSLKTKIFEDVSSGRASEIVLNNASGLDEWPILLFIKGLGIEKIVFHTHDQEIIRRWEERLTSYETLFLEDPDNLKFNECQWDEIDPNSNSALISAVRIQQERDRNYLQVNSSVPPMNAPLGITEDARVKFFSEARRQSPQEVLSRFLAILREFRSGTQRMDPVVWACLLGDTLTIALEEKLLEKAIQIADEHKLHLSPLWNNLERTQKFFAAYDPKSNEVAAWSKIFDSLPSQQLVTYMEILLGTPAGPQILKLMNHRAQQEPGTLIDICFSSNALVQKLLLQWLAPMWKPFHYGRILNALESALSHSGDSDLVRLWIVALLRSSKANAYDDLAKLFQPKFFKIWGSRTDLASKRMILNALSEYPSAECREFLRKIRRHVQGDLADQVEKLLLGYREVRS